MVNMCSQTVEQFNADMCRVIDLIRSGREEDARVLFNEEIFPRYSDIMYSDEDTALRVVAFFFYDVSDYLNKSSWREAGASTSNYIIDVYNSDFQDAVRQAIKKETGG